MPLTRTAAAARLSFPSLAGLAVALVLCVCAGRASAQQSILLEIVDEPGQIPIVRATGNSPLIDSNSTTAFDGVTLFGIFTADFPRSANELDGDLSVGSVELDRADNAVVGGFNLVLYNNSSLAPLVFSTIAPAFTGQATIPAFGTDAPLPPEGTIGDIYLGGNTSGLNGPVLGQFQVVPEPSVTPAVGLALLGLAATRRCRHGRRDRDGDDHRS